MEDTSAVKLAKLKYIEREIRLRTAELGPMGVFKGRFASSLLTSSFLCVPFLVGLPGSEVLSLTSETLCLLPSFPLLPRWLNWTLRRDLAIAVVGQPTGSDYAVF